MRIVGSSPPSDVSAACASFSVAKFTCTRLAISHFPNLMQFDLTSKISLKEAKHCMAAPMDFYSEEFISTKWGKDYHNVKIKVRISDVLVFNTVEEMRFEIKRLRSSAP